MTQPMMNVKMLTPRESQSLHPHAIVPRAGMPARLLSIELSQPLPRLSEQLNEAGPACASALATLFLHGAPLGVVELGEEVLNSPAALGDAIWQSLQPAIASHLRADGLPVPPRLEATGLPLEAPPLCVEERARFLRRAPFASVVIATRDRPRHITLCLDYIDKLDYPNFELIVVDNAPSTQATAELVLGRCGRVKPKYILEPVPGLSRARNRGLEAASAPIVAFVDDDARPDALWLTELVRSFETGNRVACVTGLVLPFELETTAQVWFEQLSRHSKGFEPRIFDAGRHRPPDALFPYAVGTFGVGANLAFDAAVLRSIGGFDLALGAGTSARGGEDLDVCFRLISRGYQIVYQPRAFVYHQHPRDYAVVRQKVFDYGVGLTAFLTKSVVADPRRLVDMTSRLPHALNHLLSPASPKNLTKGSTYPSAFRHRELRGMLYGPLAYARSLRQLFTPPAATSVAAVEPDGAAVRIPG